MGKRNHFLWKIKQLLEDIDEDTLAYEEKEFWMVQSPYEYVEYYSYEHQLQNTAIALPLARGLHNGDHRKSTMMKDGVTYRLPYLIHPLRVCRMLMDLQVPVSREEEDILLAAALCHDMIEDIPFLEHGKELVIQYHLDPRVYTTVKKVSKRRDFTEQEEKDFFHQIEEDKLAMLIKLSDRGNNVEDLYNMSVWKVHEYVDETKRFFIPMCEYGKIHYPELHACIAILQDKIVCLTEAAEILVDRYDLREQELKAQVESLRKENESLRTSWKRMWKGEDD